MKKKPNIDRLMNELSGGSAFFPNYKGGRSAATPPPEPAAGRPEPSGAKSPTRQAEREQPERVNARTPVRANGKRIITRNSFEIYEDQMDTLRKRALEEKLEGRLGSMSAMVREAIDHFLTDLTPKKAS
jgi:hypothetical protein